MASTTTERESGVDSPSRPRVSSRSRVPSGPARLLHSLAERVSVIRRALDRPLTSYYLLLGASALLLTIGLIMVMSASSVYSYRENGDSYAVVKRQLMWVVIGLPVAWTASRMPQRVIRKLVWPALGMSMLLLALTRTPLGLTRNGQTNWLAVGPIAIQPPRSPSSR